MQKKVDYFIIGLGLAGSTLAWELLSRGKSILVFDQPGLNRASSVAAGLFNPITGKVMGKTWMADAIFPFLEKFYRSAESTLGKKFFYPLPIYRPFVSPQERAQWKEKAGSESVRSFVANFHEQPVFEAQVRNPFGGIEIAHSGYLDVSSWLNAVRDHLKSTGSYTEDRWEFQSGVLSHHGVEADKVIYCEGVHALKNKIFNYLPIHPLKGEVIRVKLEQTMERIYNRGVFVVPGHDERTYTVGSTYERAPFEERNEDKVLLEIRNKMEQLISCQFEQVHQDWGIRPTTPDRRPMLGEHPQFKNLIIYNGLGTKGVSLAPYFANHLVNWLGGDGDLMPEVNIYRFKSLYSG